MINVGVVGATGIVGDIFLELLEERGFPIGELRLFASEQSAGKEIKFKNKGIALQVLQEGCFDDLNLVFFSSGDDISLEWGPKAVAAGAFAVDNSAAFRMDSKTALVVPEINSQLLPNKDQPVLIANPNCSTIQLVVALNALKKFGLESVNVASYQAASGAGKAAISELKVQMRQALDDQPIEHKEFSAPLAMNCIPQIGSIKEDGFCTEEKKIILETKKILDLAKLMVSAQTVRIPTLVGHAEAVWVKLDQDVSREQIVAAFAEQDGLEFSDENYPMVADCKNKNPVFVGRLRKDIDQPNVWLFWVVADNLRKGAALNGIQIAERIFDLS